MSGVTREMIEEAIRERGAQQAAQTGTPQAGPVTSDMIREVIRERNGNPLVALNPPPDVRPSVVDPRLQENRLVPPLETNPGTPNTLQEPQRPAEAPGDRPPDFSLRQLGREARDAGLAFSTGIVRTIPGLEYVRQRLSAIGRTYTQGEDYETALRTVQEDTARVRRENPITALAGEVAGTGVAVAAAPSVFGLRAGAGQAERVILGGGTAALQTGANILTDTGNINEAVGGAAVAGLVGAVLTPWFARMGGSAGQQTASLATTGQRFQNPTADAMRAAADDIFQQIDNAGIRVSARAWDQVGQRIRQELAQHTVSNRPAEITRALDAIDNIVAGRVATPFRTMETLRSELVAAARNKAPDAERARFIATRALAAVDDVVENVLGSRVAPISIASGAAPTMTLAQRNQLSREARNIWRMRSNVEKVDRAIELAANHTSGIASGLRSEFAKLARDRKFMQGLNSSEREAIREMARFYNFRGIGMMLSKMDPSRSNLRMMSILGAGGGFAAGGPVGAIGVLAAGRGATAATDRAMTSRAMEARRVLGGIRPVGRETGRQVGAGAGNLAARYLGGG